MQDESKPGATAGLEFRPPLEEFEAFIRGRIEVAGRFGESSQLDVLTSALELGKQVLTKALLPHEVFPPLAEEEPLAAEADEDSAAGEDIEEVEVDLEED